MKPVKIEFPAATIVSRPRFEHDRYNRFIRFEPAVREPRRAIRLTARGSDSVLTGLLYESVFLSIANVISVSLEGSLRVTNTQPEENRRSVPLHQKVMKAICARNATRARSAMTSLLNDAASRIEKSSQG